MAVKDVEREIVPNEAMPVDRSEDTVNIHLFKDGGKYKGDVFVAVNGKRIVIKRGETVKVPRKYAEVLERSMAQDSATADLIEQKTMEYRAASKVFDS